jgi:hypothetical protein
MRSTLWLNLATITLVLTGPALASSSNVNRSAQSLNRLSSRAGVTGTSLSQYFFHLSASGDGQHGGVDRAAPHECLELFDDTLAARSATLECLSYRHTRYDEDFFQDLFSLHAYKSKAHTTAELQMSLALITYLKDITRESLVSQGKAASWFEKDVGFVSAKKYTDFKYQNGDIVLGLGNSSVSSLISQVTDPKSHYSHAFLVRVNADGQISSYESLIETGVKHFDQAHFLKDHYNQLTVLRWSDPRTRSSVTSQALAFADEVARAGAGYDSRIDMNDDHKMFCSELVAKAYAEGSGLSVQELVPSFSKIKSDAVFDFINDMGVANRDMLSPGDFLNSPYFEVVGEFRPAQDLVRSWELYLMGDLMIDRLERGFKVYSAPEYILLPLPVFLLQLLPSALDSDLRLIPESVGPRAFAKMATTELKIYKPAIRRLESELKGRRGLRKTSLWQMRASLESKLDSFEARAFFHP